MAGDVQEHIADEDEINEEEIDDDDELWSNQAMHMMYSEDLNAGEMFNPINPFGTRFDGREMLKRKAWMESTDGNELVFTRFENE
ncbi:hypothetical protein Bca4012_063995 [Brassica carinata]|uniref:Uncharacterized protein n=1 Tax=Brassica carinata TaxID=52824 RepID=A0A8X7SEV3_BRACI|nr:hypothetical protein Bca52824_033499 [Brassica carinata]